MTGDVFRRGYKELSNEQVRLMFEIKLKAEELYAFYDSIEQTRETTLAKTKLEESVMWAIKSLT